MVWPSLKVTVSDLSVYILSILLLFFVAADLKCHSSKWTKVQKVHEQLGSV